MLERIGKYKKFKPKDREYSFTLYSFESKTDFSTNDILEGQSIVFISERVKKLKPIMSMNDEEFANMF